MFKKGYWLMDEGDAGGDGGTGAAGDAGAAGGAANAGAAGAAGAAAGATSYGAAGAGAGAGTVLQAGADKPAIPEKYQVKKEDGSIDIEASALKLAEGYAAAQKRIGSGDIPPKTVADYKVTLPDTMKEYEIEKDKAFTDFRERAHKAGMTQAQFDLVMGEYFRVAPELVGGAKALDAESCVSELRTAWKSDAQFKAEVGNAYKAAVAYGGDDAEGIMKDYGNDPRIVRMMAKAGSELGEDKTPSNGGGLPAGQSVEALMTSEAYTNPKHVDHARVSAQVSAEFDRRAKAAARAGRAPVM
jgi:hypothetical protein